MALDFVALDFETAGLDRGTPCAIGMVKFLDGAPVETFALRLKPTPRDWDPESQPLESFFHPMCVNVHGIKARDVADAPAFFEVWPDAQAFIAGLPLVAHNAAFDMSVLRHSLDYAGEVWPEITYACTLVLSRPTYTLASYRLPFVADAAGIPFDGELHHGAEYDANVAGRILLDIAGRHEADSLQALAKKIPARLGRLHQWGWVACSAGQYGQARSPRTSLPTDVVVNVDADPSHPLFGLGITFTGTMASMTREEARHLVASLGATPLANTTKQTNLLVFGEQDASRLKPGAKQSSKYEKAVAMKADGADIEVISEADFLTLLLDGASEGEKDRPVSTSGD